MSLPAESTQEPANESVNEGMNVNPDLSAQLRENWFEYPVQVYPHHTDCAGIVWHGSYIAWMEEARIEYLRLFGVGYDQLVDMGCELPVIELSLRYHRSLQLGNTAVIKTRMTGMAGVRMNWDYRIESVDGQTLYVTAQVKLVPIDREKGKIMRHLPSAIKDILTKLAPQVAGSAGYCGFSRLAAPPDRAL